MTSAAAAGTEGSRGFTADPRLSREGALQDGVMRDGIVSSLKKILEEGVATDRKTEVAQAPESFNQRGVLV